MNPDLICLHCMGQLEYPDEVCPHCGTAPASNVNAPNQLECGSILAGTYLVGCVLGQGGFGITYIGLDLNLNLKVAIKEYYPEGYVTREGQTRTGVVPLPGERKVLFEHGKERFVSEAKTLAIFGDDPSIVGVRAFFYENGTAYIVMHFVEGETLKEYVKQRGGKLPVREVLAMMEPLFASLSKVHSAGLLHRDISPDNIMRKKNGSLVLLDFGAARQMSIDGEHSNTINVKHGFAPEEQYRTHGDQGAWTDVYALCATIYRLTTGVTPTEALDRMANDEPLTPPSAYGADFTPEQEAALMRGLALRANARTKDLDELTKELYGAYSSNVKPIPGKQTIHEASHHNFDGKIESQQKERTGDHFNIEQNDEDRNNENRYTGKRKGNSVFPIVFFVIVMIVVGFIFIQPRIGGLNDLSQEATASAEVTLLYPDPVSITLNYNQTYQCSVRDFNTDHSVSDQDISWSCTDSVSGLKCSFAGLIEAGVLQLSPESGYNTDVEVKGIAPNGLTLRYLVQVGNGQTYSFEMSSSPRAMKTVHVNTLIASPEIVDCTGLTVNYGFEMTKGKFSASNWSVWVRDNNDQWVFIQDIDSTAGQGKEYVIDFDQQITVSEIVIQPPREYNAFSYNMTLQIVHIKH